ncbi:TPA: hypothetical protein QC364_000841 [Bacillus cereus]|uniref:hypothetical protein n=1 Tax=Bacillus paranthracis TaxID=2026186 RepID=UPI002D7926D4|nr:hypothetical protein [Bacillus paranthracis]HDR8454042.1 hypothetical protein [Bacillus cereus]
MDKSIQDSLLDAIDIMVSERIKKMNYTSSSIGKVISVSLPNCVVKLADNEISCTLPEHLHDWVQKDDVVIIQDLYNDNTKKAVIGKVGSSRPTSFVMYDQDIGKGVSGVDVTEDPSTGKISDDVILELE